MRRTFEEATMGISKIMDLFGLGDDKPEELEIAMEKQILRDVHQENHGSDGTRSNGAREALVKPGADPPAGELPDNVRLLKVGRCQSCGDQLMERDERPCAWCNIPCRADQDGFHLVHVALGSFQERHYFCCDDCYEAFRRMYPARVHRNCYERLCDDCNLCTKRFINESDGFRAQEQTTRVKAAVTPEKA